MSVYFLSYSPSLTQFTGKAYQEPCSERPVPYGEPMSLLAIFTELRQAAKTDLASAFARHTGGRHFSFLRQHGLEEAIAQVGEELHTQYIPSFMASRARPGEFRRLAVAVRGRPDLIARTRQGYWVD